MWYPAIIEFCKSNDLTVTTLFFLVGLPDVQNSPWAQRFKRGGFPEKNVQERLSWLTELSLFEDISPISDDFLFYKDLFDDFITTTQPEQKKPLLSSLLEKATSLIYLGKPIPKRVRNRQKDQIKAIAKSNGTPVPQPELPKPEIAIEEIKQSTEQLPIVQNFDQTITVVLPVNVAYKLLLAGIAAVESQKIDGVEHILTPENFCQFDGTITKEDLAQTKRLMTLLRGRLAFISQLADDSLIDHAHKFLQNEFDELYYILQILGDKMPLVAAREMEKKRQENEKLKKLLGGKK